MITTPTVSGKPGQAPIRVIRHWTVPPEDELEFPSE